MNRVWNLWCSISGTDPGDARLKLAFNTDPRVASLSASSVELVEKAAVELWGSTLGRGHYDFVDLWLAAVTEAQRRLDDEIELERRHQAERAAQKRQNEELERRLLVEHQRRVEERERGRLEEAMALRRREANAELQAELAAGLLKRAEAAERLRGEHWTAIRVRQKIKGLYNITPVENLLSIATRGILSHDRAEHLEHRDFSDSGVQDRRGGRIVAGGERLHHYASLYIYPRNAMLYRLVQEGQDLVVLRVSTEVLDEPGIVITNGNAASRESDSWQGIRGLAKISLDRIYSRDWTVDADLRRTTQAEVLVPRVVHPRFILGFLAPSYATYERAIQAAPSMSGTVDRDLFFDAPAPGH